MRPRCSPALLAQWWAGCGRLSHTVQGTEASRPAVDPTVGLRHSHNCCILFRSSLAHCDCVRGGATHGARADWMEGVGGGLWGAGKGRGLDSPGEASLPIALINIISVASRRDLVPLCGRG